MLTSIPRIIKPRIIPICAIQWIVFRQTSHLLCFDVQHLTDVWNYTYRTYYPFQIADIDDHKVASPTHESVLIIWSNNLNTILQKPMSRFVTLGLQSQSHYEALKLHVERHKNGRISEPPSAEFFDLWYLLNTIVLASLYAIMTKVLIEDGHRATAQTELCFHPHTLQILASFFWAKDLLAIIGHSYVPDNYLRKRILDMVSSA